MHEAVCSNCGNSCQVPFKPSTNKPIYCDNCFDKKGPKKSFDRPRFDRPNFDKPRSENNEALIKKIDQMNTNLEKIIELLTPKPKASKSKEK